MIKKVNLIDRVKLSIKLNKLVKVKYTQSKIKLYIGEDRVTIKDKRCIIRYNSMNLLQIRYLVKLLLGLNIKGLSSSKSRLDTLGSDVKYIGDYYTYVLDRYKGSYRLIISDCRKY